MRASLHPQAPLPVPQAASTAVPSALHRAAVQFESMLLSELLKPLSKGLQGDADGAKDATGDDGSGPLQSFGTEALATHLAASGSLGFARQIEDALTARAPKKIANDPNVLQADADKATEER